MPNHHKKKHGKKTPTPTQIPFQASRNARTCTACLLLLLLRPAHTASVAGARAADLLAHTAHHGDDDDGEFAQTQPSSGRVGTSFRTARATARTTAEEESQLFSRALYAAVQVGESIRRT